MLCNVDLVHRQQNFFLLHICLTDANSVLVWFSFIAQQIFTILNEFVICFADKLIGKLVLGSYMFARGKALQQWNSAIACPMEQKQEWHILCE